jgi:hypothetical protein
MQERIRAYLRDWDKSPSLDNIDFESSIYLKRAEKKGHNYEFGKYDSRDGSVEVIIERPDPVSKALPESQEEWLAKRKFYLQQGCSDAKIFREGMAEGYLTDDDWMEAGQIDTQLTDLEDDYEGEKLERMHEEHKVDMRNRVRTERRRERMVDLNGRVLAFKKIGGLLGRKLSKKEVEENPWEVYEELKQFYCANAPNTRIYDAWIDEVVFALGI